MGGKFSSEVWPLGLRNDGQNGNEEDFLPLLSLDERGGVTTPRGLGRIGKDWEGPDSVRAGQGGLERASVWKRLDSRGKLHCAII